jgi:hypothetical protein
MHSNKFSVRFVNISTSLCAFQCLLCVFLCLFVLVWGFPPPYDGKSTGDLHLGAFMCLLSVLCAFIF